MTITPHERPPGRRDRRRPPEGHAPVPTPPSKHAALLRQLPAARVSLAYLRAAGHPDAADTLTQIVDYAEDNARREVAATRASTNRSLRVTEAFREHVYAQKAAGAEDEGERLSTVVEDSLQDFIDGLWTPANPGRARRGTSPAKVSLNVRVGHDIWDAANSKAQDKDEIEARGYKLTASAIAIAALVERFGLPESEQGTTTA